MDSFDLEDAIRIRANLGTWGGGGRWVKEALSIKVVAFDVETLSPIYTPSIIASLEFTNNTSASDTQTFADSKNITNTHTVTNSSTISAGLTEQFQVQAKFFGFGGSSTTTLSFRYDVGRSDAQANAVQQSWSWNTSIQVPPRSRIVADIIVQDAQFDPKFEAVVEISGQAVLEDTTNGQSRKWVYDLGFLFSHLQYIPPVEIVDNQTIRVKIGGVYKGVLGLRQSVSVTQFSLENNNVIAVYGGDNAVSMMTT